MSNNLRTQLAALEAISNAPTIPNYLPLPSAFRDGMVSVPLVIKDYLSKTGQMPELNQDGKIQIEKYVEVMKASGLHNKCKVWATRYIIIEDEKFKSIKDGRQ